MVSLIAKAKLQNFKTSKLKNAYHFDKMDIKNFKFPEFIDTVSINTLNSKIRDIIKKYLSNNYQSYYREELDEKKDFSNMEFLYLIKFYKEGGKIKIPYQEEYFPAWAFSYNFDPLEKEIHKIIGLAYDNIEANFCKWYLNETHTFSAKEVTYLLFYFTLLHQIKTENQPPPTK